MSITLKQLLSGEVDLEVKESIKQRVGSVKRTEQETTLNRLEPDALAEDKVINLPFNEVHYNNQTAREEAKPGWYIWCFDTKECWYLESEELLNMWFVYRDDLTIQYCETKEEAIAFLEEHVFKWDRLTITRKSCYILDIPANETYVCYYQSNYPTLRYGVATPQGMFIHKYKNRFYRDLAIMKLDKLYNEASKQMAEQLTKVKIAAMDAIIISDGAWMKEVCAAAHFYLDNVSTIKMVEGFMPTVSDQAVLIAELTGAYNALSMCRARGKKRIFYFYDNTSIINVFKNRKTEYIEEVKRYKELLNQLSREKVQVEFIELHPKSSQEKDTLNKALTFYHNTCDSECRVICDIVKKDYKDYIAAEGATTNIGSIISMGQKPRKPNNNNNRRR